MQRDSSAGASASASITEEVTALLHGLNPQQVLGGLSREELTLKSLKSFYLEELERVQLEAELMQRQIAELERDTGSGNSAAPHDSTLANEQKVDSHSGMIAGGSDGVGGADDALASEELADAQLRSLLEDEIAQDATTESSAALHTDLEPQHAAHSTHNDATQSNMHR